MDANNIDEARGAAADDTNDKEHDYIIRAVVVGGIDEEVVNALRVKQRIPSAGTGDEPRQVILSSRRSQAKVEQVPRWL